MKPAMKLKLILPMGLLAALLAGCGTTGCAGFKAVYLDASSIDGLTDRDAGAILAHNETGAKLCGW